MATNVRTDNKNLITQYCCSHVVQPADPVFLVPKGDPGVAPHFNMSAVINNPAGTVFDHRTRVAHNDSYLGVGIHAPVVIVGRNTGMHNGDTGFLSFAKDLFIETRKAVMHEVEASVNAAWQKLAPALQTAVSNAETIATGITPGKIAEVAKDDAAEMLKALLSTDTLIALVKTIAMMGVTAIPVVGTIAGGAATVMRVKNVIEQTAGAMDELKEMLERWTHPMSKAQIEEEQKKLIRLILRLAAKGLAAALGLALKFAKDKMSAKSVGKDNSKNVKHDAGTGHKPNDPPCACALGGPVFIITGEKYLEVTDFDLPGLVPFDWTRKYRSGDTRQSWFGQGWSTPFSVTLALRADGLSYHEAGGRALALPTVAVGAEHFDALEQFTLCHPSNNEWQIVFKGGLKQSFLRLREDMFELPLANISDRHGNQIRFDFPNLPEDPFAPWRPRAIHDSVGRTLQLSWTPQGLLTAVHWRPRPNDDLRCMTEYHYSAEGDLIVQRDAAGTQRRYEWRNHVLTAYTRPDGARHCAEYDEYSPAGRVIHSYAATDGRGLRFSYDPRARTTHVTDNLGRVSHYEYDSRPNIIATTGPDGVRIETPFDSNGHPRGSVDALGRQTQLSYDQRGNLSTIVDASGAQTRIEHNALDLPSAVTTPLGDSWLYDYDDQGNLATVTDPLNRVTRYARDSRGLLAAIIDARGGQKSLEWDADGNLVGWTDCSGQHSSFSYDAAGQLLVQRDALGQETHYEWNASGRLHALREPSGATHRYSWSAEGRLLSYLDPLGVTTRWRYNAHGDPLERIDGNGNILRYEYDAVGRLTALINENGQQTRFGYDLADNLTDEIGFDGRHQRYAYNAAGELTHLIETGGSDLGPGKVTHFERDALGRLLAKHAEGDASCSSQFRYDAVGQLLAADTPAAQLAFAYDPAGQLLSETQTLAGGAARTLAHRYDPLGNRTRSQLPDGRALNWLFYGSGHLHQINLEEGGTHHVISDIERDALHREVSRSQGKLESRYDYDPMGRLARHRVSYKHRAEIRIERGYAYDLAGNLSGRVDSLRGKVAYRYDPTGRILTAQGFQQEAFAFDPAGNLLNSQGNPGRSTGTVVDNRLKVFQDLRFEYDEHGNVSSRERGAHEHTTLTWNADHQLQEATVVRRGMTQKTRYEYDALGRRTRKIDAFGATDYLWDGDLMIESRRGNKAALFIFEPDNFVPLATIQDGQTYWYQCDQAGVPQELTDAGGQLAWAADYRVWGEATVWKTGTDDVPMSTQAWSPRPHTQQATAQPVRPLLEQPFRFQGQQFDEETGLHYSFHRYYDPSSARFISQDPIGLAGGENLYQYAPNPSGWADPWGNKRKQAQPGAPTHASNQANPINGRMPINSCFAGKTMVGSDLPKNVRGKYPHGVPFNMNGFPDFSRYAVKTVDIGGFTSDTADFSAANKKAGLPGTKAPEGFTWHHTQENGKLQLIPSDIHNAAKHTGGAAVCGTRR